MKSINNKAYSTISDSVLIAVRKELSISVSNLVESSVWHSLSVKVYMSVRNLKVEILDEIN